MFSQAWRLLTRLAHGAYHYSALPYYRERGGASLFAGRKIMLIFKLILLKFTVVKFGKSLVGI